MVTKINIERNMIKRENRFFRTIINKLQNQNNCHECYTIEKEEIYRKFEKSARERHNKTYNSNYSPDLKGKQDYGNQQMSLTSFQADKSRKNSARSAYKLKQKLCVNICNNNSSNISPTSYCDTCRFDRQTTSAYYNSTTSSDFGNSYNCIRNFTSTESMEDYLHNYYLDLGDLKYETEIPIRYTFSDNSLFGNNETAGALALRKSSSNSSLTPMFSSRHLYSNNNDEMEAEFVLKVRKEGI